MTLEPAKVPQHLELDDVVAWGCSAADLLCLVVGALIAWWLYLAVPAEFGTRVVAAVPPLAMGFAVGLMRLDGRSLRDWLALVLAFALRARILVTGGRP